MVGGLLDVLHALRVGEREVRGNPVDGLRLRGRQPALADLRLGRKGLEPRALDEHAPPDEPELGEDLLQFAALVRITPVNRADRQKRIDIHALYYTTSHGLKANANVLPPAVRLGLRLEVTG